MLISAVVVVHMTLAVMAKLEALAFYVENFGVRQGFEMYKYLGVENLPNGVISWLQADMADGDSSVDDLVEGGSDTTKLYRVMSDAEYESLMSNGQFTPYDMAMEEKWFATSMEDAEEWASHFYPDGNYRMVEIEVNTGSLSNMYYNGYLDGIGPAYCSPLDVINEAIQSIKGVK